MGDGTSTGPGVPEPGSWHSGYPETKKVDRGMVAFLLFAALVTFFVIGFGAFELEGSVSDWVLWPIFGILLFVFLAAFQEAFHDAGVERDPMSPTYVVLAIALFLAVVVSTSIP